MNISNPPKFKMMNGIHNDTLTYISYFLLPDKLWGIQTGLRSMKV